MIEKAIEYAAKGEQVIHGLPAHYQAYFEYYASLCGIRGDKQKLEEIINMARSRLNRPELDVVRMHATCSVFVIMTVVFLNRKCSCG